MTDRPRILFYSHDTCGLGHIRRTQAIADAVLSDLGDASALVVTGASSLRTLRLGSGSDIVKLPCVTKVANDRYAPKYLDVEFGALRTMREQIILSTARSFRPTLLVVDNVPLGMMGELEATLVELSAGRPRPRVMLTLRDVVDEPTRVMQDWRRKGTYEALERFYDHVVVYGMPEVFDVVREYRLSATIARRVSYAGYIRRTTDLAAAQALRRSLLGEGEHLIVVTVGGGADGARLLETYLAGSHSRTGRQIRTFMVLGPDLPADGRARVHALCRHRADVVVAEFCDDLPTTIAAADVVVSMGGYNTVCEILAAQKPAVIVPRVEPRLEQWVRCRRLAHAGFIRVVHPREATADRLWAEIHRASTERARPVLRLRFDGLRAVSALVRDMHARPLAIGA